MYLAGPMGDWGWADVNAAVDNLGKIATPGLAIYQAVTGERPPDVVQQFFPQQPVPPPAPAPAPVPPPVPFTPATVQPMMPSPPDSSWGFTPWLVAAIAGGGVLVGGVVWLVSRGVKRQPRLVSR